MRILLFEEDISVRTMLLIFLTRQGHEVITYQGTEAEPDPVPTYHCTHEQACVDVLLMDLRTAGLTAGGMTSLELIEHRLGNGRKILPENIAVLSSYWTAEYTAHLSKSGYQVFEKPFLLTELQEWLSTRTSRTQVDCPEPTCPVFGSASHVGTHL